jgi:hypothetical protein
MTVSFWPNMNNNIKNSLDHRCDLYLTALIARMVAQQVDMVSPGFDSEGKERTGFARKIRGFYFYLQNFFKMNKSGFDWTR